MSEKPDLILREHPCHGSWYALWDAADTGAVPTGETPIGRTPERRRWSG